MAEYVATEVLAYVRAVVEAAPFSLQPSPVPYDFSRVPQDTIDGAYRLEHTATRSIGAFDFCETREDDVALWVARIHGEDVTATMDGLLVLAHSLVAAIAREGVRRDFDLRDEGRGVEISSAAGTSYAVARVALPLAYAARL